MGNRPTTGAIASAELVTGGRLGDKQKYPTCFGDMRIEGVAGIIDDNTHASELVNALDNTLTALRFAAYSLSEVTGKRFDKSPVYLDARKLVDLCRQ